MAYWCIDPVDGDNGTGSSQITQALAETTPFKTWAAVTMSANDTYLQKRGTTTTVSSSINLRAGVLISAYGTGDKPIIQSIDDTVACINAFGTGDWIVEYIEFLVCLRAISQGGAVQSTVENRTVRYCTFNGCGTLAAVGSAVRFSTGSGGYDYVHNNTFIGCLNTVVQFGADGSYTQSGVDIYRNLFISNLATGNPSEGHIIDVSVQGSNANIWRNYFYDNTYLDGSPSNGGSLVSLDGTTDCEVWGNLFYANHVSRCVGFVAQNGYASSGHACANNAFVSNGQTIDAGSDGDVDRVIDMKNSLAAANDFDTIIANNIFSGNDSQTDPSAGVIWINTTEALGSTTGITIVDNIYYNNVHAETVYINEGGGTITITDDGGILSDPLLDSNHNPAMNSLAIGAGMKWWTGVNREGYNGEPFSDFDTDIGANQSTFGPFHPKNL